MSMRVEESLDELRRSLAGTILGPADQGYDDARRCFNALVERRPAVIARVAGSADVATAFDFARGHGLEVVGRVAAQHGGRFVVRHGERGTVAALELPLAGVAAPAVARATA